MIKYGFFDSRYSPPEPVYFALNLLGTYLFSRTHLVMTKYLPPDISTVHDCFIRNLNFVIFSTDINREKNKKGENVQFTCNVRVYKQFSN